jgi:DNA-binding response OmpR family regulator
LAKLLLVEDDKDLAQTVLDSLRGERYDVEYASDGTLGLEMLKYTQFDVIILDWELPEMTGVDILKKFRMSGGQTPVLMLTGRSAVTDKETGLDAGADDYLTKPFDLRELVARIRAMLRRRTVASSSLLTYKDIVLDPLSHKVTRAGKPVHVLPRDFALLEFLMRHPNEIFAVESLLVRVWESDSEASPEGLRVAIRRLRKALDTSEELSDSIIENVSRVGYRLRQ